MKEFFDDLNEMMQVYRDKGGKEVSRNPDGSQDGTQWTLQDLFAKLDTNNNGVITQTEFVAGIQGLGMGSGMDESMMAQIFGLIDFEMKKHGEKNKVPKTKEGQNDDAQWQAAFGKDW